MLHPSYNKPLLYRFGYHSSGWLDKVADGIKPEPWGKNFQVLNYYLLINFQIAKQQKRVLENENIALWKPGFLKNQINDPVWMCYEPNVYEGTKIKWQFKKLMSGDNPYKDVYAKDYQVEYKIPEFHQDWDIYLDQYALRHIFEKSENVNRLKAVFNNITDNPHLIFRTIYGELMLQAKDFLHYPQWYRGKFHFLMPLFLKSPDKTDLVATLTPNANLNRYEVSTLLLPGMVYGAVRSIVTNRRLLPAWLLLDEQDFIKEYEALDKYGLGDIEEDNSGLLSEP